MARKKKGKQKPTTRVVAVIDIGSSALRLLIAEVAAKPTRGLNPKWRILDGAERPVPLGRDVFESSVIGRKTMADALDTLRVFREMMSAYPIADVVAIGTSALREARNQESFIDRVRIQTGIEIRVIDGIEANQLTYLAVRKALGNAKPAIARSNALIMEVGGGSTELMLLHRGHMVAAHTLPIGTIRIDRQLQSIRAGGGSLTAHFLREHTRSMLESIEAELDLKRVAHLVAVGGDARLAAKRIGTGDNGDYSRIPAEAFRAFIHHIEGLSLDEVVTELNVSYGDAEPLLPALLIYLIFLEATAAKQMVVPSVSIREGVLVSHGSDPEFIRTLFRRQIIASARSLAEHYGADMEHADQVREITLQIFAALAKEHGMTAHHRTIIEAAAILHDIGSFISGSSHHKHGQYIIDNSEIFGISPEDKAVLSNIVRYHRKAKPQASHSAYASLPREARVVIMKAAAILRVADALDRAHHRRIRDARIEIGDDELIIHSNTLGDLSLEQYSLQRKADLFEEVFGLRVVLR